MTNNRKIELLKEKVKKQIGERQTSGFKLLINYYPDDAKDQVDDIFKIIESELASLKDEGEKVISKGNLNWHWITEEIRKLINKYKPTPYGELALTNEIVNYIRSEINSHPSPAVEKCYPEKKQSVTDEGEKHSQEDGEAKGIPIFVFTAKDKISLSVLDYYRQLCRAEECPQTHISEIGTRIDDFKNWQKNNLEKVKNPD